MPRHIIFQKVLNNERMAEMNLLITIEPRSYREAIGGAISMLRPNVTVTVAGPRELESEAIRLSPEMVISGAPSPFALESRLAWIEFLPYTHPQAKFCLAGRRSEMEKVELDDLLSVVDEVETLSKTNTPNGC